MHVAVSAVFCGWYIHTWVGPGAVAIGVICFQAERWPNLAFSFERLCCVI